MSRSARRAGRRRSAAVAAVVALATALTACGGSPELAGNRIPGHRLTIYTSLSLHGPSAPVARAVLAGERRALEAAGGHVGELAVRLVALDDTTAVAGGWDPGQTTAAAQTALADPTSVAYIGDLASGASAVAIPLLNRSGIPQISPTSSAVGLTSLRPGASPGEPGKYYPTGVQTFVALPPDDASQAAAQISLQRGFGCSRIDVLNDESVDGYDAAASYGLLAHAAGLTVVGSESFDPRLRDFTSLARSLAGVAPDCVLVSAMPGPASSILVAQVAAALPRARLFATAPLAAPAFVDPGAGGVPAAIASRLLITVPGRTALDPRAGWRGLEQPFGLLGYEAMRLVLRAVGAASHGGHTTVRRSAVRADLLRAHDTGSPFGPLTVHRDGTTTLDTWTVMRIRNGALVPAATLRGV